MSDADPTILPDRPTSRWLIVDGQGRVLLFRFDYADGPLAGTAFWATPGGGCDPGETYADAACRELFEETGVRSVELLGRTGGWIVYDFPEGMGGPKAWKGFKGQKQVWFAFRFTGEDSEFDLEAHGEPEFDAWRWARLDETPELIIPFKQDVYRQVVRHFAPFAGGAGKTD